MAQLHPASRLNWQQNQARFSSIDRDVVDLDEALEVTLAVCDGHNLPNDQCILAHLLQHSTQMAQQCYAYQPELRYRSGTGPPARDRVDRAADLQWLQGCMGVWQVPGPTLREYPC